MSAAASSRAYSPGHRTLVLAAARSDSPHPGLRRLESRTTPPSEFHMAVARERIPRQVPQALDGPPLTLADVGRRRRHGRDIVEDRERFGYVLSAGGRNRGGGAGDRRSALLPFGQWFDPAVLPGSWRYVAWSLT